MLEVLSSSIELTAAGLASNGQYLGKLGTGSAIC
jgi:hypothetical protein